MSNIYLTDSNEDSIADFVKDHEEFYDKTNEYFEDKARKECLFERFANSRKLSVKVCKTSFGWQRKHYSKLMQSKSRQAPKEMTERQNWIQDKFGFLRSYMTSPELPPTQTEWRSACSQQTPHYSLNKSPDPLGLQGVLQWTILANATSRHETRLSV